MITNQIAPSTIQQIDPIVRAVSSLSTSSLSSLVAKNDELVRSDLEAFREIFFICLVVATIAVFAGVVLEEGEDLMDVIKHVLPLDPITAYRWAKKLVKVGWILIVIGVAGEGIFEVCVTRADKILGAFDNILLTEAKKEASDAVLGAAAANIQVAEARQRVAELTASNLKLEEAIEPRRLTPNQIRELESLVQFAGHSSVDLGSYFNDPEGLVLSSQILDALTKAHITIVDNRSTMTAGSNVFLGVFVQQHGNRAEDQALQENLKAILSENGLTKTAVISRRIPGAPAGFAMFFGEVEAPPNSVRISVGVKPIK